MGRSKIMKCPPMEPTPRLILTQSWHERGASQVDKTVLEKCKYCQWRQLSPGRGPLQLGRVDGGDGGAPARLVRDPVQRVLGRVPAVATQTEIFSY